MNKARVFTTHWFNGRKPHFAEALSQFEGKKDLEFLEIGCWEGQCTCWLADTFPGAMISVVDTFGGNPEHKEATGYDLENLQNVFMNNVDSFTDRLIIYPKPSEEALPELFLNFRRYDFIYIDGSHTARDVMFDAELSWKILNKGGIMAFDDYTWRKDYPETETPKIAIDAFLRIHANELELLHKKACVIIRKK